MERVSELHGGLAGFVAALRPGDEGDSSETSALQLVTLPGNIRVLFVSDFFSMLAPSDRPLAMWLSALFVAVLYFPKCGLLPSAQPTTNELYQAAKRHVPASVTLRKPLPASLPEFDTWMPTLDPVLVTVGKRVVLGGKASKQQSQDHVTAALNPWKRAASHRSRPAGTGGGSGGSPTGSREGQQQREAARLRAFLVARVPATFFVPLREVATAAFQKQFPHVACDANALRAFLTDHLPAGFVDVQTFGGMPSLDSVFIRLLHPPPPAAVTADTDGVTAPDAALSPTYSVFALGERIVRELAALRARDPESKARQASGIRASELAGMMSQETRAQLAAFLSPRGNPHQGGHTSEWEDRCILIVDRLRHIFDVRLRDRVFRPWSVLPPAEQPSSLTRETTPLPLVLRHAESMLRAETLSIADLFQRLPALLRQQLLAAYAESRWLTATAADLDSEATRMKGARCLRGFLVQHSLYFAMRSDAAGQEMVCSPHFLAASVGGGEAFAFDGGSAEGGPKGRWASAKTLTEVEKAELVYHALPPDQPVAWTHFSNTPKVRALPFPAFSLRQEFFKRHFSFFRVFEPFAGNTLVVGRADVRPPPQRVLQPPQRSIEAILKHVALLSVGGTTDGAATQSLSREGRALVKQWGDVVSLVEQLPQWFEVRRDTFNTGNSLITYVGPGHADEVPARDLVAPCLPLRRVRNDASCYLPEAVSEAEARFAEWDPDWDE